MNLGQVKLMYETIEDGPVTVQELDVLIVNLTNATIAAMMFMTMMKMVNKVAAA